MKHNHPPVISMVLLALIIGLSISGGPVIWAVMVMLAPLALAMYFTTRGMVHGSHPDAGGHAIRHNSHFQPEKPHL